jgi:DNA primase
MTDIVDVVGDYVRLKKRGSNFVGLCPFHGEKTPSFNVNPGLNIYKCFGCGVGGDVFNFVSEIEHLSFPETVRLLADRVGVLIPEQTEPSEEASEAESVYHALRFAARFFFERLTQSESGQVARTYLNGRGFTAETVKTFGIGYAEAGWDNLLGAGVREKIDEQILEKAGLVISRKEGDGYYDRYRGRIIFPIVSHVGKVLGFGGRVLDPEDEPRYINSPETIVYNKSRVLYGLFHARQEIRKREEAILVEGYTDVVSLHQSGVGNAVATCGTSLTQDQIHLLSRYAKVVVLLYDADSAGIRAAFKAIDLILGSGMAPYAVSLPENEDPDSFARKVGPEAFRDYLEEQRQDFVHFILRHSRERGKMETPEGQATVQRAILKSLAKIPDPLVQESYLKLASSAMDIPDMQLRSIMKKYGRSSAGRPPSRPRTASRLPDPGIPEGRENYGEESTILPEEKMLLRLMLEKGLPLVGFILGHMALSDFSTGLPRDMASRLVTMYEAGSIDRDVFISGSAGEGLRRLAAELMLRDVEPSENWELKRNITVPRLNEDEREAAIGAMTLLKLDRVDEAIRSQKEKIYRAERGGEDIQTLQKEMIHLYALRKTIEERKFIGDVQGV